MKMVGSQRGMVVFCYWICLLDAHLARRAQHRRLRYIVPALVATQLVIVVKDTTFGYVVTYGELMQNAKVLIANYRSLVPVYLVVAVLYCLVNYAISRASQRLGRPVY